MAADIHPGDLGFFATLAGAGSLSAAARELGVTTPAVSKHLALMEQRLGIALVHRTTRRMGLTPEGEIYLREARQILEQIEGLGQALRKTKAVPKGLLRINATLGFGRSHIAPLISDFVQAHPQIAVQLQLSASPPPLVDDTYDVCVRFGPPPDQRIVAAHIAPNRRLLCAAPSYLARRGTPRTPRDLHGHDCIYIRQGTEAYGVWRLTPLRDHEDHATAVKVGGSLTTNDGEIAVLWALRGHGIVMRAEWDIHPHLDSGALVPVLPGYRTPDADIYAVYPASFRASARVKAFVDFLRTRLADGHLGQAGKPKAVRAKAGAQAD